MIQIIAILCSLSNPSNCHEQTITNSNIEELQMSDCYNQAKLADWMRQHPAERLAGTKCVFGKPPKET